MSEFVQICFTFDVHVANKSIAVYNGSKLHRQCLADFCFAFMDIDNSIIGPKIDRIVLSVAVPLDASEDFPRHPAAAAT